MLFFYVFGLLSMRVKSVIGLASVAAILSLASGLAFGAEFSRAGTGALVYFVLGLIWFWLLDKTRDTIFMWFMIFLPGPYGMLLAALAAEITICGPPA